ncbi:MAG: hypothetical protein ABEJ84_06585 [Halodesulfurarchaeum sp.]
MAASMDGINVAGSVGWISGRADQSLRWFALGEAEPCVRHQIVVALSQLVILPARTKYFLQFSTISQEYSTPDNIIHHFYQDYLDPGQSSGKFTMT